ncbi:MAG: hypothetical protein AAF557_24320 [Pseudomonadota bacterium]
MTRQQISWSIFALGFLAAVASILFEVKPNEPMWDRNHPDYAERFAYAEKLNQINPGFSEKQRAKTLATIPPIMKNIRNRFPDAPEDSYAHAETKLENAVDVFFSDSATGVRHFWATYYSVDDMMLIIHKDRLPYWPYLLDRLRVSWTHRRALPVLRRMMSELKETSDKEMSAVARQIYKSFQKTN